MKNRLPMKLTKTEVAEFSAVLGSAPVLTSESDRDYNEIWENLIVTFASSGIRSGCLAPASVVVSPHPMGIEILSLALEDPLSQLSATGLPSLPLRTHPLGTICRFHPLVGRRGAK
jgi:hypothetical protein